MKDIFFDDAETKEHFIAYENVDGLYDLYVSKGDDKQLFLLADFLPHVIVFYASCWTAIKNQVFIERTIYKVKFHVCKVCGFHEVAFYPDGMEHIVCPRCSHKEKVENT